MAVLAGYVLAATVGGAMAGGVIATAGGVVDAEVRAGLAALAGAGGVALGLAGVLGRVRKPPLQCDRETPQRWVRQGRARWAVKNGAALGFGGFTRMGFLLWYVLPFGAFLAGDPLVGAAVWGAYGLVRAAGAAGIWAVLARRPDADVLWLAGQRDRMYAATAGCLAALGLATFVLAGL